MALRWLIDTGRDEEGMIVLADLHGGNLEDPKAVAEFREISHAVEQEASQFLSSISSRSFVPWLVL